MSYIWYFTSSPLYTSVKQVSLIKKQPEFCLSLLLTAGSCLLTLICIAALSAACLRPHRTLCFLPLKTFKTNKTLSLPIDSTHNINGYLPVISRGVSFYTTWKGHPYRQAQLTCLTLTKWAGGSNWGAILLHIPGKQFQDKEIPKRHKKILNSKHNRLSIEKRSCIAPFWCDTLSGACVCVYWDDQLHTSLNKSSCRIKLPAYPTFKQSKAFEIFLENRVKVVLRIYPDFNRKCSEMSRNLHCFSVQVLICSYLDQKSKLRMGGNSHSLKEAFTP